MIGSGHELLPVVPIVERELMGVETGTGPRR